MKRLNEFENAKNIIDEQLKNARNIITQSDALTQCIAELKSCHEFFKANGEEKKPIKVRLTVTPTTIRIIAQKTKLSELGYDVTLYTKCSDALVTYVDKYTSANDRMNTIIDSIDEYVQKVPTTITILEKIQSQLREGARDGGAVRALERWLSRLQRMLQLMFPETVRVTIEEAEAEPEPETVRVTIEDGGGRRRRRRTRARRSRRGARRSRLNRRKQSLKKPAQ